MNKLIEAAKKLNPFRRMSTTEAIKQDCNDRMTAAYKLIDESKSAIAIASYKQRMAQAELNAVLSYLRSLPDEQ